MVRFLDTGYETWTTYQKINNKTLKDKSIVVPTVFGVGINDADYVTQPWNGGQRTICPFMRCWRNLLLRCYTDRDPTYADCSVCDEWLTFSKFKAWMEVQDWEEKELDKDLLFKGNRVYSPDTCLFVTHEVNCFILENTGVKTELPLGVHYNKVNRLYVAQMNSGSTIGRYIGSSRSVEEAAQMWLAAKKKRAEYLADKETCPRTAEALLKRYA